MLFNSPVFLFVFLPLVLFFYYFSPIRLRNIVLLLASIVFYFWGQPDFIFILIILIYLNHTFGRLIEQYKITNKSFAKKILFLSIILNLGLLGYYKYRVFLLSNLIILNRFIPIPENVLSILNANIPFLPLAISFFTFHAISYQIDIYRNQSSAQKSFIKLALYFLMFPHLLAGPILRYHLMQEQLEKRFIKVEDFAWAINRFVLGLAKKVLIADRLASAANETFAIPATRIDTSTAWLGLICFTLQIYFDFSAYSDMAIALAKMFGFKFPENFNYPYISSSIREFWTRWHITLSNWFRDYLYIPLGGNKCSPLRNYINLWIVFLLVGLWHGAGWNFIIWGAIQAFFLVMERLGLNRLILWKPIGHIYTIFAVMIGWVFFRSENLGQALTYLKTLFGFGDNQLVKYRPLQYFLANDLIFVICIAIIIALPVYPFIRRSAGLLISKYTKYSRFLELTMKGVGILYFILLLFLSYLVMAMQTYRPFIYFKF